MKVLVTGDREWTDVEMIAAVLRRFPSDTVIVHGAGRGADRIAGAVAGSLGMRVRAYPADWDRYGRPAGVIRNQHMLDAEHVWGDPIDVAVAFHDDIGNSKGTGDMVKRLDRASVRRFVFCHDAPRG